MTTLKLEADKTALIREIVNIDNVELINQLRDFLRKRASNQRVNDKEFNKLHTHRMIKEFCGAWKDERSAEEMVDDIYNTRLSTGEDPTNIFNE